MPYLTIENKDRVYNEEQCFGDLEYPGDQGDVRRYLDLDEVRSPGELNFAITKLIQCYLDNKTGPNIKLSYQLINDVLGATEGAKAEFYRRVAVKYEDQKIIENGDVYE